MREPIQSIILISLLLFVSLTPLNQQDFYSLNTDYLEISESYPESESQLDYPDEIESQDNKKARSNNENQIPFSSSDNLIEQNAHGGSWVDSFDDDSGIVPLLSDSINISNGEVNLNDTGYKIVFEDDFSTNLNASKWVNKTGNGTTVYTYPFLKAVKNNQAQTSEALLETRDHFNYLRIVEWEWNSYYDSHSNGFGHNIVIMENKSENIYFYVPINADRTIKIGDSVVYYLYTSPNPINSQQWYKFRMLISEYYAHLQVRDMSDTLIINKTVNSTTFPINEIGPFTISFASVSGSTSFSFESWMDNVKIYEKKYYHSGNMTSKKIEIPENMRWEKLIINKTEIHNTSVKITLLNATTNHIIAGYENLTFNGEMDISSLNNLGDRSIRLKAYFQGNNLSSSRLHFWELSWNATKTWRDSLFTVDKIGQYNNITLDEGFINVSNDGYIQSEMINISDKHYYGSLLINKSQPPGYYLNVSIEDAQTGIPIPGCVNISGSKMNLTDLNPHDFKSIRLNASFSSASGRYAELYDWSVNWSANNAPKFIDINSDISLNRTRSIVLRINLTDKEDTESNLTLIIEYKSPSDLTWQTQYCTSPVYINDHWESTFSPPADAEIGYYTFKFTCNDSFQATDVYPFQYIIKVSNNKPQILSIITSATVVKRSATVKITIDVSDIEISDDLLDLDVKYKAPSDVLWKTDYLNNLNYNNGNQKWEVDFAPPITAELGYYNFNIICNDSDDEDTGIALIKVLNNNPIIWDLIYSDSEIYRTETVSMIINVTDVEIQKSDIVVAVKYKSPLDTEWQNDYITKKLFSSGVWLTDFTPPKTADLGSYSFLVTCNDTDTEVTGEFEIFVLNNIPSQPLVTISPLKPVTTDELKVIVTNFNDIETEQLQLELWLRWYKDSLYQNQYDNLTKISASSTVKYEIWTCRVFVSDGDDLSQFGEDSVTIQNSPPIINKTVSTLKMKEDKMDNSLFLTDLFSDADNDDLTFDITGNVNLEANIDISTDNVALIPSSNWFGIETLTFSANDSEAEVSQDIVVNVQPENDPPELIRVGTIDVTSHDQILKFSVYEGSWLNLTLIGKDIDGDTISISSNRTDDVEADDIEEITIVEKWKNQYILSFLPTNSDVGSIPMNVSISDRNGSVVYYILTIDVYNLNNPPIVEIINPINNSRFDYNATINFTCIYSDPDLLISDPDEVLYFTWKTNKSTKALGSDKFLTNLTNVILNPGVHEISVTVEDKEGSIGSSTVTITVDEKKKEEPVDGKEEPEDGKEKTKDVSEMNSRIILLIITIIVVIILLLIVMFYIKKKRKPAEKAEPGERKEQEVITSEEPGSSSIEKPKIEQTNSVQPIQQPPQQSLQQPEQSIAQQETTSITTQ